ncbi:MAG: cupredoxin domain-containing protein [Bacillota bacterium]
MKRWIISVAAVAMLGVLAGCSGGAKETGPVETIDLTTTGMAFSTKEITLEKGKTYKLVLNNSDSVEHDFSIDKIPAKIVKAGHDDGHGSKKADLHVHAAAGKKESVTFTPTEAGAYTFYCSVIGHKDAGMVGQLVVK